MRSNLFVTWPKLQTAVKLRRPMGCETHAAETKALSKLRGILAHNE
jgi:hypothetical protein